ncbi:hypothetical protein BCR42DRAFT_369838 [Absidia repens]|uniref:Non-specific serine/threonine protein kinase n=1 Tax=Absidia repens TaxID=90262 RepID=A0A1X2IPP5_9FUNG|nr:hypothetical protein BCR42DRAFT_369838 [Absidia repens]
MTDSMHTSAPLVSSISSTLLRLLPHMNPSEVTGQSTTTNTNGDNHSISTDASCSSCNSSCPSFSSDQKLLGQYRLVKTLGVGEFGKVKLGIRTDTEEKVAIKLVKKKNVGAKLAKVEREIQILKSLHHPHIVNLIEVVETDTLVGIVLEYASGGELFEYVWSHKSLGEDNAKNLFAQLISGVNHMHLKGVAHRDLKLENLLFSNKQQTHLLISDFGFSNNDNNNLLSTCCGSPTYAAPELIHSTGSYNGETADVWSCGVILYCMICGYLPFDDDPENPESSNLRRLYRHIQSSTLSFPEFVNADAKNLMQQMLRPDPATRCTLQDVINHPWLQACYSADFGSPTKQLEQHTLDSYKKQQSIIHSKIQSKSDRPSQAKRQQHDSTPVPPLQGNTNFQEHHYMTHPSPEVIHHRQQHHDLDNQVLSQQQDNHQGQKQMASVQMDASQTQHPTGTLPPTPRSMMAVLKMSSSTETNNTTSSTSSSRIETKELPNLPPMPPITPEEEVALNDFGPIVQQHQKHPSLRRQKKFRPSLMNAQPMPLLSATKLATMTNESQHSWVDDKNSNFGIRPSLLGKSNSPHFEEHSNKKMNTGSADEVYGNSVQNMKSVSLPLLNQANQHSMAIDTTTSTTNFNKSNNSNNDKPVAIEKQHRRFASILSRTPSKPRPQPQRSQSISIPRKGTFDDDVDDQGTVLKRNDTSTSTSATAPVTRRKTMTQAMKAWIHKNRPFTKQEVSSLSSLSEPSSASAASTRDINNTSDDQQQTATNHHCSDYQHHLQQQEEQEEDQQVHHYLAPSSLATSTVDQSTMRTFSHAQGEHLTSMAPGHLILMLVRVLTALGFDVQHRSSYQLTCLRKSHHPHLHFYSWHHLGSAKQKKKKDNNNNNKAVTVSNTPIYGPPELDKGQEVEFTVEVCRSLLSDIYVVDVQHENGDIASFQFLRSKLLCLLNLNM